MRTALSVVAALALALAGTASAAVKRSAFTASVAQGDYASLSVTVAPKARCTIKVVYKTGMSRARGLGTKSGTTITWRWRVGSNTSPGRWPVTVDCGKAGTLSLQLRVRAS